MALESVTEELTTQDTGSTPISQPQPGDMHSPEVKQGDESPAHEPESTTSTQGGGGGEPDINDRSEPEAQNANPEPASSGGAAEAANDGADPYIQPADELQSDDYLPVSYQYNSHRQAWNQALASPLHLPAPQRLNSSGSNYSEWRSAMEILIRLRGYERYFSRDSYNTTTTTTTTTNTTSGASPLPPSGLPAPQPSHDRFEADEYNAWMAWEVGNANAQLFLETSIAGDAAAARAAMQGKNSAREMWAALEELYGGL
jgi:hypothetical protein